MSKKNVTLMPLESDDREQFILDNQEVFRYGAMEEFGMRDDHFEEDGEIISRQTIAESIDAENAETYRIVCDGKKVGGAVIHIDEETSTGNLDLLFVSPHVHSQGIGFAAWQNIERMHPEIKVWETVTPYFEKRNIHFYVNRCGFHIIEFYNSHHPDPNDPEMTERQICSNSGHSWHDSADIQGKEDDFDGMFRFQKIM